MPELNRPSPKSIQGLLMDDSTVADGLPIYRGPKLPPFPLRRPSITWGRILKCQREAYTFDAEIAGRRVALKVFQPSMLCGDDTYTRLGYTDPLLRECVAYGRLSKAQEYGILDFPIAVACHGYVVLGGDDFREILVRGARMRRPSTFLYGLVKDFMPGKWGIGDASLSDIEKSVRFLNDIGIYNRNIGQDNFRGRLLDDFSCSWTDHAYIYPRLLDVRFPTLDVRRDDVIQFNKMKDMIQYSAHQQAIGHNTPHVSRLLALPQDIRYIIYEFVYGGQDLLKLTHDSAGVHRRYSGYQDFLNCSQTCSAVRKDMRSFYRHRTTHYISDIEVSEYLETPLVAACKAVRIAIESVNYVNLLPMLHLREKTLMHLETGGSHFSIPFEVLNAVFENRSLLWTQWLHKGVVKEVRYFGRSWEKFIEIVIDQATMEIMKTKYGGSLGVNWSRKLAFPCEPGTPQVCVSAHAV